MEKKLNLCKYMTDITPNIILSKPQLGENIGSSARAMKNFGIEKLRLIEPRDGWPNSSAYAISAGADDILNNTITETDISDSFKARDSDKLDALDSTQFLRSDVNDNLTAAIIVPTANRDE